MDFLNNVFGAVGDAAQKVARKSADAVEYSKIKYSVYDINNEIKKLYTEIGQCAYNCYISGNTTDLPISDKCEEIQELKKKLDEMQQRMDSLKFSIRCPKCGKSIKSDVSYCPFCGAALAKDVDGEVDGGEYSASAEPENTADSDESNADEEYYTSTFRVPEEQDGESGEEKPQE